MSGTVDRHGRPASISAWRPGFSFIDRLRKLSRSAALSLAGRGIAGLRAKRTVMRAGPARLLFCLVAAVTSAALADPLVEGLSNRGVFGSGRFTDHSYADVLPALAAALVFAALFVVGVVRRTVPRSRLGHATAWLRESRAAVPPQTAMRLFPVTFALQIVTLFGAETLEQIAVAGHAFGGAVWLGGPVLASLGLHAAIGLLVVAVLARLLDWVARSIVEVIDLLRRLVLEWDSLSPLRAVIGSLAPPRPLDVPAIAASHGRAPPHFHAR